MLTAETPATIVLKTEVCVSINVALARATEYGAGDYFTKDARRERKR